MNNLVKHIRNELLRSYPDDEALALAWWTAEELTGLSRTELMLTECDIQIAGLDTVLDKLTNFVPIQYIFSHTEWLGLDLVVSPAVLIPRVETAELVGLITESIHNQAAGVIVDIGTGSGCIALALKQRLPDWQVVGIDCSKAALQIAKTNSERLHLDVDWFHADVFVSEQMEAVRHRLRQGKIVIVSNPPYICYNERPTMSRSTLLHEPELALMVPDDDPLRFYRQIGELHWGEQLWYELSETQGQALLALMQEQGYDARIIKDSYGKDRFAQGRVLLRPC